MFVVCSKASRSISVWKLKVEGRGQVWLVEKQWQVLATFTTVERPRDKFYPRYWLLHWCDGRLTRVANSTDEPLTGVATFARLYNKRELRNDELYSACGGTAALAQRVGSQIGRAPRSAPPSTKLHLLMLRDVVSEPPSVKVF